MPAKKVTSGRVTPKREKKVSTAKQWKQGKMYELEVPSGNVCLVRKPDGMKAFMANGTIPNSLLPLVEEALGEKSDGNLDIKAIMADPQKMNDMMDMIDVITVNVVVEPKVHPVPMIADDSDGDEPAPGYPMPISDRPSDRLYVDEIDLEDKLVIMGWATGGLNDLQKFREETARNVATLADVAELPVDSLVDNGDR